MASRDINPSYDFNIINEYLPHVEAIKTEMT